MYVKKIGPLIAFVGCAASMLSAFDAEAACGHRHRRAACCNPCCDPCCGTIVETVPCITTSCGSVCGPVVVEEVVVSGCCVASSRPVVVTEIVTAAPRPATRTAAVPVSVTRRVR
ncbi:MAG: hypothetical protein EBX36_05590 [Planctomycetia bacterium]|nr:hypothetical protein [Planctomycetia bacterium]